MSRTQVRMSCRTTETAHMYMHTVLEKFDDRMTNKSREKKIDRNTIVCTEIKKLRRNFVCGFFDRFKVDSPLAMRLGG